MSDDASASQSRGGRRRPLHALDGPRVDDGLFGPGSAVWKVWTSASMYVAAYRSVVVQMLWPEIGHGVDVFSDFSTDPLGRLRRTGHYFAAMALADTPTTEHVARQVRAIHGRVRSVEPITGREYCALDPELLLYVHVTGWQSGLVCYERFNGPLTATERAEYLRDGAVGTELAGLPSAMVPTTASDVRAYYADIAPRLAYGQHAMNVVRWFARPTLPRPYRPLEPGIRLLADGTAATLPRHIGRMTQLRRSDLRLATSTMAIRAGVRVLDNPMLGAWQQQVVPEAYDLVQQARARQAEWEREQGTPQPGALSRAASSARRLVAVP